jgi:hypothetical protein
MARLTPVLIAMLGVFLLRAQPPSPSASASSASSPTRQAPPASEHAARGVGYEDVTAATGLSGFRHVSGAEEPRYIIDATGSGAAIWDFDNDGFADIYLLNGSSLDRVRAGRAAPPAAMFRNNGDGTFTDVTAKTGLANERWGQGVCVGDIDNDGVEDVYVTNFGKNRLYRGTSSGRFDDVAEQAGVALDGWSTGCAFGDFDGDGWLDLFVAGYVALDLAHLPPAPSAPAAGAAAADGSATQSPAARVAAATQAEAVGLGASYSAGAAACRYRGAAVICGPRGLPGAPDHLFRNNHDGTFTDVSVAAGVADAEGRYGFGVAWVDFDDDGRLDLFVANDSGPNYLYRNLRNGRFEDVSYRSGAALDRDGRSQAHMGVAIGDYDNDDRDDIHVTNFADDFNVLYHNDGWFGFSDVSHPSGLAAVTLPFLGWGTSFLDYDNDGRLDLFVANGHTYPQADRLDWNTSYAQRALLFRNLDGRRFEEIGAAAGAALTMPRAGRGAAVGDLDNDGALDIVINTLDGPPVVARNTIAAATAAGAGAGAAATAATAAGATATATAGATAVEAGGAERAAADTAADTAAGASALARPRGHWLTLRLHGDPRKGCPRDAIGAVVIVTAAGGPRVRGEVASGRGYLSQSDLRVHIGLGEATRIDVIEVRWPNGANVIYPGGGHIDAIVDIDEATGPRPRSRSRKADSRFKIARAAGG